MKCLELKGGKKGRTAYLYCQGGLLAEFLGTATQGAELVAKFNRHAELVKALRQLANGCGGHEQALALLEQIDAEATQ